jgi:hypothetical protein
MRQAIIKSAGPRRSTRVGACCVSARRADVRLFLQIAKGAKETIEIPRPDYSGSNEWVAELVVTSNKKGTIGVQAYAVCAR